MAALKDECEAMKPYQVCATKCILRAGHPLPHRTATNETWDGDGPCTERTSTDEPCMLYNGHDGQHHGFYGSHWPSNPVRPWVYCHARYDGDEPCILGHHHEGEHFGANGTHWS